MNNIAYIIGQVFGIIAIALGFLAYQVKTKSRLMGVLTATGVVFCIHYLLIGAYTGMALNLINIARNLAYERRRAKGSDEIITPIVFVAIQVIISIFTWDAWYSIFVLLGIGINTYCVSFKNPQNVRKSIILTSPLVFTYDAFASSYGGMVYEFVAWVSAIIGIFRMKSRGVNADEAEDKTVNKLSENVNN